MKPWDIYTYSFEGAGSHPAVIAGSDSVDGRPGASHPGHMGVRNVRGGLTAVSMPELSRAALWSALKSRHCYGTTGPRILLRLTAGDAQMGDVGVGQIRMGQHERPLGGNPLPDGDPFAHQEGDGRGGRPRLGDDHGGDAVGDLIPGSGHVADMGEGQRGKAAIARLGEDVGTGGHGGQVAVVEDRSFGNARRTARPHHGDRIAGQL